MSFETLDIVFALVGIYVFLSLICTTAKELIAQLFEKRAETLLTGLHRLLDGDRGFEPSWRRWLLSWIGGLDRKIDLSALGDESLTKRLYDHSLVRELAEGSGKPSYIPPQTFATALLDLINPVSGEDSRTLTSVRESVKELPEELPLRSSLLSLIDEAGEDLDQFREGLKTWYDERMDRVASWYKQHTQRAVVVLAALIAIVPNADTLQMADRLAANNVLRKAAVQQAQVVAESEHFFSDTTAASSGAGARSGTAASSGLTVSPETLADSTRKWVNAYEKMGIPLGWEAVTLPDESFAWTWGKILAWCWAWLVFVISKAFGLALTTLAISLGAPFWFDMLRKISMIRSGGRSPREK